MGGVQSVTGWVQDTELGFTLVHEHVAASSGQRESRVVVPGLEELGVPADVISGILVDNPRRWLSGG